MSKKLRIIGPYTPEHEGPFCTRDGSPVEILTKKDRRGEILGYQADSKELTTWCENGQFDNTRMSNTAYDLMNAREVPVAREAELSVRDDMHLAKAVAVFNRTPGLTPYVVKEVISAWLGSKGMDGVYVREVLPGEGE